MEDALYAEAPPKSAQDAKGGPLTTKVKGFRFHTNQRCASSQSGLESESRPHSRAPVTITSLSRGAGVTGAETRSERRTRQGHAARLSLWLCPVTWSWLEDKQAVGRPGSLLRHPEILNHLKAPTPSPNRREALLQRRPWCLVCWATGWSRSRLAIESLHPHSCLRGSCASLFCGATHHVPWP